ncbi:MAG: methyltransferase [Chromatiaceae bacterium]
MTTPPPSPTLADQADRHQLYEQSVQCPQAEVDFIDRTYRDLRLKTAQRLREDFCGTAALCCEWVRRRKTNQATGIDIDPEVLDWGRSHNLARLDEAQAKRVTLRLDNVLAVETGTQDIVCALNFSYWLLTKRASLLTYFRQVRNSLKPDGVFFLDAYGGYDAYRLTAEERVIQGDQGLFTYIWDQAHYDPISGRLICHIHFAFSDGSRLEQAFSYDWRLWSLPEIRELLAEAGFGRVLCYWQGWDAQGEPDGIFVPVEEGEPEAGWIAYLTAER